jgi:hypothetical protein
MTPKEEKVYVEGKRVVWRQLLGEALKALGGDRKTEAQWLLEREDAIAALRSLCREHGDNDWTEDLHLADIVNKHLGRHLAK